MKKHYYLIVLLLTCKICEGQNLIPNGDFEQYSGCPDNVAQLDSASFWFNPTYATPDYFNSCSNPSIVGVPNNTGVGYQNAYGGSAYSGIHLWHMNVPNYREYIEVPLLSTLTFNVCYELKMYISLSEFSSYNSSALGVYFSKTSFTNFSTSYNLPFIPQINNSSLNLPDFINWTLVTGSYTAQGGESFLILGNFKSDLNTTVTLTPNIGDNVVYIYIDSVYLAPCFPTSNHEQIVNGAIDINPNPFFNRINIRLQNNQQSEIILYDITGRNLLQQRFTNSTSLNTEQLADGIYIYQLRNKSGTSTSGKVIKQ